METPEILKFRSEVTVPAEEVIETPEILKFRSEATVPADVEVETAKIKLLGKAAVTDVVDETPEIPANTSGLGCGVSRGVSEVADSPNISNPG